MERLTGSLRHKKLFLLDIDGTISFDATPIKGTLDFMAEVRAQGGKYIFITNNSTKGIADYVIKFTKMGIEVEESNFLTASYAKSIKMPCCMWQGLLRFAGNWKALVCGSPKGWKRKSGQW